MDPAENSSECTPAEIWHDEGEKFCLMGDSDSISSIEALVNSNNRAAALINTPLRKEKIQNIITIRKLTYRIYAKREGFFAVNGNEEFYLGTTKGYIIKSLRELKVRHSARPPKQEEYSLI